jgi:DNA-binding protein YbaB
MGNGNVTAKEMKKMQDRMTEIQREMSGMEMHK